MIDCETGGGEGVGGAVNCLETVVRDPPAACHDSKNASEHGIIKIYIFDKLF